MSEKYKDLLNNAIWYYYGKDEAKKYFGEIPKDRYFTFDFCLKYLNEKKSKVNVLELGTSRSFVDGRFEGCNSDDTKYWEPNNPEKWDWSAGCFTIFFSELLNNYKLTTLDICKEHLERCKIMTSKNRENIDYIHSKSQDFLLSTKEKYDLIYLDTGDMTPIESTALLHLEEAKIIVERDLLKKNGIVLIDDVKSVVPKRAGEPSMYGKAKYSIPYFLNHKIKLIIQEYQCILQKI